MNWLIWSLGIGILLLSCIIYYLLKPRKVEKVDEVQDELPRWVDE